MRKCKRCKNVHCTSILRGNIGVVSNLCNVCFWYFYCSEDETIIDDIYTYFNTSHNMIYVNEDNGRRVYEFY